LRLRAGLVISFVVALLVSAGSIIECAAETAAQKNIATPLPPARPAEPAVHDKAHSTGSTSKEGLSPGGAAESAAAPAKQRALPRNAIAPKNPPTSENPPQPSSGRDSEVMFPSLPAATRTRMRDCGREWQEMKKTGQAKELTWRDFAAGCLTRHSE
jgi:hypothetical protein